MDKLADYKIKLRKIRVNNNMTTYIDYYKSDKTIFGIVKNQDIMLHKQPITNKKLSLLKSNRIITEENLKISDAKCIKPYRTFSYFLSEEEFQTLGDFNFDDY